MFDLLDTFQIIHFYIIFNFTKKQSELYTEDLQAA